MRLFQWNETLANRRDLFVQMVNEADYAAPMAGLSLTVEIVKAGSSAYAPITGSVAEVGEGTYRVSLAAADLDTQGEAMLKASAAGAVTQFVPLQVVRFPDEVHLAKAALVNLRTHTIDTGVNVIKDDDEVTTLTTLTPSEANGVITITPGP
jgi:hypothetical protein